MCLIKAKVKANVCQKRYRDYNVGGYKNLILLDWWWDSVTSEINTNINVNMY